MYEKETKNGAVMKNVSPVLQEIIQLIVFMNDLILSPGERVSKFQDTLRWDGISESERVVDLSADKKVLTLSKASVGGTSVGCSIECLKDLTAGLHAFNFRVCGINVESGGPNITLSAADFVLSWKSGRLIVNGNDATGYGGTLVEGDVVTVGLDVDKSVLIFFRNGVSLGPVLGGPHSRASVEYSISGSACTLSVDFEGTIELLGIKENSIFSAVRKSNLIGNSTGGSDVDDIESELLATTPKWLLPLQEGMSMMKSYVLRDIPSNKFKSDFLRPLVERYKRVFSGDLEQAYVNSLQSVSEGQDQHVLLEKKHKMDGAKSMVVLLDGITFPPDVSVLISDGSGEIQATYDGLNTAIVDKGTEFVQTVPVGPKKLKLRLQLQGNIEVNRRSSPSLQSNTNILSQLKHGAIVEVDEEPVEGFWRISDGSGYLKSYADEVAYVDITDVPENSLPVQRHPHLMTLQTRTTARCDVCQSPCGSTPGGAYCSPCNYDECASCYKKHAPFSTFSFINKAGVTASLGSGRCDATYYCGRRLGREIIPGSDGQCGPNNGPSCPDCRLLKQICAETTAGKKDDGKASKNTFEVGDIVVRNDAWAWGQEDGGPGAAGVIVETKLSWNDEEEEGVLVKWNGQSSPYKYFFRDVKLLRRTESSSVDSSTKVVVIGDSVTIKVVRKINVTVDSEVPSELRYNFQVHPVITPAAAISNFASDYQDIKQIYSAGHGGDLALVRHLNAVAARKNINSGLLSIAWKDVMPTADDLAKSSQLKALCETNVQVPVFDDEDNDKVKPSTKSGNGLLSIGTKFRGDFAITNEIDDVGSSFTVAGFFELTVTESSEPSSDGEVKVSFNVIETSNFASFLPAADAELDQIGVLAQWASDIVEEPSVYESTSTGLLSISSGMLHMEDTDVPVKISGKAQDSSGKRVWNLVLLDGVHFEGLYIEGHNEPVNISLTRVEESIDIASTNKIYSGPNVGSSFDGQVLSPETKYYSFKEKLDAALDAHPSDCKAITLEQNSSDPSKPYYLLRGEGNLVTTAVETTSAPPVQLCEDGHEMACWLSNNLPSDYIAIANKLSIETPVVCGELYSTIFEILCHVCQFKAILLAFLAFFIGPEPYCNIHNCSYFVT